MQDVVFLVFGVTMPKISEFYGLSVYMNCFDVHPPFLPHIHVRYQESQASISIVNGSVLAGDLSSKHLRLIKRWVEEHADELKKNWDLAVNGKQTFRISPLN